MVSRRAISCSLSVICVSLIGNNAFPLHHLAHEQKRSIRTLLPYKSVDPIENEHISSSPPSNSGSDTITSDINIVNEYGGSDDASVEDNAWLSATRTLGSLFLRQEDADRDRNIDVFGRPLVHHETESNDDTSSPFSLHENSFAKYLMDLKFQEEQNRERAATEQHGIKSDDAWRDNLSAQKVSSGIEIDQVRSCTVQYLTFGF